MHRRLLILLVVLAACGCGARESTVRSSLENGYDVQAGRYADLDDDLFASKMVQTGLWKPERFAEVIGFGIFLDEPHVPGRTPVLLLHGHAAGPRIFQAFADMLDRERYEPWYGFYPTGLDVDTLASLLRESLTATASDLGVDEVVVVCHSMGGIVARAALRPSDDDDALPRIPTVITLATPWNGSERAGAWAWSPAAPPSWKDLRPGSTFLLHLFDDPLPEGTHLHVLYGTAGETASIPGDDDGVVSHASLTREEALEEASSVTVFELSDHIGMIVDSGPLSRVLEILDSSLD